MTTVSDLQWKQIVVGGIVPHVISTGLLIAWLVAYTFLLAFQTGGEPDGGALQQFSTISGTLIFPLLTILLTVVAAGWVAQRVDSDTVTIHGVAVGVLAGLVGFAFGALDVMMLIRFGLTVGAGVLGAKLAPALLRG
ncbi:hypothetical protein [Haloarchaeobius amylolyticus]|uniref:hypothetical protein n=1 Tax=Haloarchaeobius amylolyticus TaxID=1198296 RepID=UPI0022717527|nr:hypothetical protein [Haloarchaeobius amylolyticus]